MSNATVLGAIFEVLAGDSTLATLVPSGTWLDEGPEEDPLPHLIVHHEGEDPLWTSETPYLETTKIHLEIYASRDVTTPGTTPNHPAEATEKIALALKAALDDHIGQVTDAAWVKLRRGHYTVKFDGRMDALGERVYRADLTYDVIIERQRKL